MTTATVATATMYSKPGCMQCRQTAKEFEKQGIDLDIVDLTQDVEAMAKVTGLGYRNVPVIVASDDNHWYGFDPDRIKGLIA